jgi:hypothetical protein
MRSAWGVHEVCMIQITVHMIYFFYIFHCPIILSQLQNDHKHKHNEDTDEDEDEDEEDDGTDLPGPLIPAAYAPVVADILATTEGAGIKLKTLIGKVGTRGDLSVR